jgi:modulator of FtsH protease HflK
MRRTRAPSEILRLAAPFTRGLDVAWHKMHWWVAAMGLLYALSGITIVRTNEVAVALRWGRLVGGTHGPGLMFAFPWPIDEVVRVPVKHVSQLLIDTLMDTGTTPSADTIDSLTQGYALTGDQNIVHVEMMARYRIKNPVDWAFYGPKENDALRVEVTAAMVRSLGEMGVDRVLADGRKALVETAMRRAQAGLDAIHSGLLLTNLELTRLAPPAAVQSDFDAVQSAYVGAETAKKNAEAYARRIVPNAQAAADAQVQSANGDAATALARAQGESKEFLDLEAQYTKNPDVVHERLYRDAVERAISHAEGVRWIPPPVGGRYNGLRIMINNTAAGPGAPPAEQQNDEQDNSVGPTQLPGTGQ